MFISGAVNNKKTKAKSTIHNRNHSVIDVQWKWPSHLK